MKYAQSINRHALKLKHTQLKRLLAIATVSEGRAKCRLCGDKTFDISNMGEAALTSHAKGAKHQSAAASGAAPAFSPPQPGQLLRQTARLSLWSTAEVMWALKVANSHYSFKSYEDASLLFQRMFPDSQIATQFACGESKCSFLCSFGLAPHLTLSDVMKRKGIRHSLRRKPE